MAAADRKKVAEKVQAALPTVTPEKIDDLIDQAEEYFLARTGRRSVPDRATCLWTDISVQIGKSGMTADSQRVVSSVKRGDTTVEYSSSAKASTGLEGLDARVALFRVVRAR